MTIRELSDFIKPTAGDNGQTQILAQFHQPQKPNTTDRQASVARSLSRSGKSVGEGAYGELRTPTHSKSRGNCCTLEPIWNQAPPEYEKSFQLGIECNKEDLDWGILISSSEIHKYT